MTFHAIRFPRSGRAAALLVAGAAGLLGPTVAPASAAEATRTSPPVVSASPGTLEVDPAESRLDLNEATAEELESLPRIGPAIARRIVDYRRTVGRFGSVDELLNVRGIGEKTLEILRPLVRVSDAEDSGS